MRKNIYENARGDLTRDEALADLVIRALWKSFPGEASEEAIANAATLYFRNPKTGEPISAKTIKYWLRGDTLPQAIHFVTLAQMQPRMFLGQIFGRSA
jgi:hypothetical protein